MTNGSEVSCRSISRSRARFIRMPANRARDPSSLSSQIEIRLFACQLCNWSDATSTLRNVPWLGTGQQLASACAGLAAPVPQPLGFVSTVEIQEVLHRRPDLSTFLVHLTRDHGGQSAKERLDEIIHTGVLRASPMGMGKRHDDPNDKDRQTQRVVCFSETPLEHIWTFTQEIEGRQIKFEPYGVVVPKFAARKIGINPVWYIDMTKAYGDDWEISATRASGPCRRSRKRMGFPRGSGRTNPSVRRADGRLEVVCGWRTRRSSGGSGSGGKSETCISGCCPISTCAQRPRSTRSFLVAQGKVVRRSTSPAGIGASASTSIRIGALSGSSRTSPDSHRKTSPRFGTTDLGGSRRGKRSSLERFGSSNRRSAIGSMVPGWLSRARRSPRPPGRWEAPPIAFETCSASKAMGGTRSRVSWLPTPESCRSRMRSGWDR